MKHFLHFTPQPGELYFTVSEHLKNALRLKTGLLPNQSKELQNLIDEAELNVRHMFNIPDEFDILFLRSTELLTKFFFNTAGVNSICFTGKSQLSRRCNYEMSLTDKVRLIEFEQVKNPVPTNPYYVPSDLVIVESDDLTTGTHFDHRNIDKKEQLIALDVSYSLTNISYDPRKVDMIFFNTNAAMGLPFNFFVAMVKKEWIELSAFNDQMPNDITPIEWYVFSKVSGDFLFKGLEQINREINYKAALLTQTLEQCPFLTPLGSTAGSASKNIFAASSEKPVYNVKAQLMNKGLIISADEETQTIAMANYPVHSKEQCEMLVDYLVRIK